MPISSDKAWNGLAFDFVELLFCDLDSVDTFEEWLSAPLHWMADHFQLQSIQVLEKRGAVWRIVAAEGNSSSPLRDDLLSQALDTQATQALSNSLAIPISNSQFSNSILGITLAPPFSSPLDRPIDKLREPLERYADGMKSPYEPGFL